MQLDELIDVVKKKADCEVYQYVGMCKDKKCIHCDYAVQYDKLQEMYADIQMRLKQEKWAMDKMEEMRVEEAD